MNNRFANFFTFALYAAAPAFLVYAVVYDINPTGIRTYTYTIDTPLVGISKLFPAHRLAGIREGKQQVKQQPVYLTVRYPHRYASATLRLAVENPKQLPWRVGLEVGGAEWSYFMETPSADGTVRFDLSNARVTQRSVRFMIAIDGLTESAPFSVDEITVQLQRPPL